MSQRVAARAAKFQAARAEIPAGVKEERKGEASRLGGTRACRYLTKRSWTERGKDRG